MLQTDTGFVPFERPWVEGIFLERPNRFVAFIDVAGERTRVQVPDPGRLKELLIPGVQVMLEDHGHNPKRKTRYALSLVKSPDQQNWVSLNTHLPNILVKHWIQARCIGPLSDYTLTKAEFCYGQSRFDFLLAGPQGQKRLLEVKSVTLVLPDGTAMFPDAPTERGARHIRELIAARQEGYESGVLFVVQRPDALKVLPNPTTDPLFCQTMADAMAAGVDFWAIGCHLSLEGVSLLPGLLPVNCQ